MASETYNKSTKFKCPHGGEVSVSASNSSVKVDGKPVLTMADVLSVSGCPFQIPAAPSPIPSPCMKVVWTVSDTSVMTQTGPTVSKSSVGICLSDKGIPQGPVKATSVQSVVKSG